MKKKKSKKKSSVWKKDIFGVLSGEVELITSKGKKIKGTAHIWPRNELN